MLKTKDGRWDKPVSRWGRVALGVLLAVAVVGVSALRCPAQMADDAAPPLSVVTFVDGGTVDAKSAPEPKEDWPNTPFRISCSPAPASYAVLFEKVLAVIDDYGFEFAYANRYDGRIETFPKAGANHGRRREASSPAVRRRACVFISALDNDGYAIDVKVFKELAFDPLGTEWAPIGRDRQMEQSMIKRLIHFDPVRAQQGP